MIDFHTSLLIKIRFFYIGSLQSTSYNSRDSVVLQLTSFVSKHRSHIVQNEMKGFATWICGLCLVAPTLPSIGAFAFHPTGTGGANHRHVALSTALSSATCDHVVPSVLQGRRFVLANLAVLSAASFRQFLVEPANASGGATAGGAYLLSAKQRYNERVKASVRGLLSTADAIKNGDSTLAKEYFESEEEGTWKEMTSAGYLLSNAFRRNSTAAPDSLPAVKVMQMRLFVSVISFV
jgi:hypothetical protein